jgi:hypothetical protein
VTLLAPKPAYFWDATTNSWRKAVVGEAGEYVWNNTTNAWEFGTIGAEYLYDHATKSWIKGPGGMYVWNATTNSWDKNTTAGGGPYYWSEASQSWVVNEGVLIPDDFSYDPAPASTGAYSADTLVSAHATNAAGTIMSNTFWTTAATKSFGVSPAGTWALLSNGSSRDQEVTTWVHQGRIFLRLNADGDAIMFEQLLSTANGTMNIALVFGVDSSTYNPTTTKNLWVNSDLKNTWGVKLGGSGDKTDGDEFTYGVEGFDIYVKYNGVEKLRFQSFHHVVSGKVGFKNNGTNQGFRETTVTFNEQATLSSSLNAAGGGTFNLLDFGLKSVATTGSIDVGVSTTTLNVVDGTNIAIGDYVLVEINGEAGAGARGTKGVGGTWPSLSYANLAAMEADTSQANNTFGWNEDTGDVYRFATGTGLWTQQTAYYQAKATPRGLRARVTAKPSTHVCTIDTAATVSTTSANVYVDMSPVLGYLGQFYSNTSTDIRAYRPSSMDIYVPAGTYYGAGAVYFQYESGTGVTFKGAGKTQTIFHTPEGFAPLQFHGYSDEFEFADFTLEQNFRLQGYGFQWGVTNRVRSWGSDGLPGYEAVSASVTETSFSNSSAYPPAVFLNAVVDGVIRNVKVVDASQKALCASLCVDTWAYDCEIEQTDAIAIYIQWAVQWASCTGGGVDGITLTSPYLFPAAEIYQSSGTIFRNLTITNGSMAYNGGELNEFDTVAVTIEANSQHSSLAFASSTTIFNSNNNNSHAAGSIDAGNIVRDLTLVVEGAINASDDILSGVVSDAAMPKFQLIDSTLTFPDFIVGGQTAFRAINVSGSNCDLTNVTVNGRSRNNITGGTGYKAVTHDGSSTAASGSTNTNVVTSPVASDTTGPS